MPNNHVSVLVCNTIRLFACVQTGPENKGMKSLPATMVRLAARCLWRRQAEIHSRPAPVGFWDSFDSIATLLDHILEGSGSYRMTFAAISSRIKCVLCVCVCPPLTAMISKSNEHTIMLTQTSWQPERHHGESFSRHSVKCCFALAAGVALMQTRFGHMFRLESLRATHVDLDQGIAGSVVRLYHVKSFN